TDQRHPKLIFENHSQHWRKLILCKWECPTDARPRFNVCLITTATNQKQQAGWLSFTNMGVEYMQAIGITFPSGSWTPCPVYRNGHREHGNTITPGTAYRFGFRFDTPERALEWLLDLFRLRQKTVSKCASSDKWPENLDAILTAKGVGQCS
ncbi:MAG: hypothetical protein WCL08_12445, partial [Verrucomicrobiota bacterium]